MVVDTPTSRILTLDDTNNVHSILYKEQMLTGSYWDELATLPAVIPEGPIAILGLGGGTAAHLILDLWPSLHLVGWEIDPILIDKARDYFGLSDLEKHNQAGGFLSIHVGDALSPSMSVPGGFAGIVVDLFSDGKVLPQLQEANTWLELEKQLMPQGRIMVNCGGADAKKSRRGEAWVKNSTVKAMSTVFNQKLSWKLMATTESENYLALTGPAPDLDSWSARVPSQLNSNVKHWKPCGL
ncbi:unnamed protein product [Spirodela intermedia]|nr:unnamed protein product [Spirodela intermedia]CAA6656473.1 unnamed protein product [Spirodela intermedia]